MRNSKIIFCLAIVFILCFAIPAFCLAGNILVISPHEKWKEKDIFEEGKTEIKDAHLYGIKFETSHDDGILFKTLQFGFESVRVKEENIKNIRLMVDENEDGVIGSNEKEVLGIGKLNLHKGILFENVKLLKTSSLIVVADIEKVIKGAMFLVTLDSGEIMASLLPSGGHVWIDAKKGPFRIAKYVVKDLLIKIEIEPSSKKVFSNENIILRGVIKYFPGLKIDEESFEKLKIPGWDIKKIVLGEKRGRSYHAQSFFIVLSLPEKTEYGKYKIPPLEVKYIDMYDNRGEIKKIYSKALEIEKSVFSVSVDVFPKIVSIGDELFLNISFYTGKNCHISENYLNNLNDWGNIGSFEIKKVNVERKKIKNDVELVEIKYILSYFGPAGRQEQIPSFEIPYEEKVAEGECLLHVYKTPEATIKIIRVTNEDDTMREMIVNFPQKNNIFYFKILLIVCVSVFGLFLLQFPVRIIRYLVIKRREKGISVDKIRGEFKKTCDGILRKGTLREEDLRSFQKKWGNFLRATLGITASADSLEFGERLSGKTRKLWNKIDKWIVVSEEVSAEEIVNEIRAIQYE